MLLNELRDIMNIYSTLSINSLTSNFNLNEKELLKYLKNFQQKEQLSFKFNELTKVIELSDIVDCYEHRKKEMTKLYSNLVNINNQVFNDQIPNNLSNMNLHVNNYDDDFDY